MKVAIFGGSFDPPHIGHIELAKKIISAELADKVLFVPSPNPPHKTDRKLTPFEDRFKMLQLAIAEFAEFEITDIENRRTGLSYTYDTILEIEKEYSNSDIFLLLGGDSLNMLDSWFNAKELVENFNFITYPRKGEDISLKYLQSKWEPKLASKLFNSIVDFPIYEISSTLIRDEIKNKNSSSKYLDEKVLEYINQKNIYSTK